MTDDFSMSPVEREIRKAMKEGMFDNLPGTGKPLKLSSREEDQVPHEMRMAFRIMKDHEIAPEWMMLGGALSQQEAKIRHELARGLRAYQGALHDADKNGDLGRRARANRTWERLISTFQEAAAQYNRGVLMYNLKVPPGVAQRHYMDIESELRKLRTVDS